MQVRHEGDAGAHADDADRSERDRAVSGVLTARETVEVDSVSWRVYGYYITSLGVWAAFAGISGMVARQARHWE